jgi:mannosyltransferase OCH1-like enzyme
MSHALIKAALRELGPAHFTDAPIPHRVHVTARSKALPDEVQQNLLRIQAHNPQWETTIYDDQDIESFIASHFGPNVLAIYRMINTRYGAARADLFRYLCMYRLGGLYLDLKSTTTMPLNQWIQPSDRFILSHWDNGPEGKYPDWGMSDEIRHFASSEYQQWFIAASAGHPYLRAVCERVLRNIVSYGPVPARFGREGVLQVTGPIAYTLAIHPIRHHHPHRFIDVEQDGGLLYSFYTVVDGHIGLSETHYSQLREPIVQLSPSATRVFKASQAVQGWWREFSREALATLAKLKRRLKVHHPR